MKKDYDGLPAALEDGMKQDSSPLTFRQQGILAAAMGAAMIAFYTLLGVI